MNKKGQFVAVSTGMLVAGHISVRAKAYLEEADVIYCLVPHPVIETWLEQCNANVVSLQPLYGEGKHRMDTYEEMIEMMMNSVREGKKVCGAFYGHAGVFAWAPHETVRQAKSEGFSAHMEPGISAEACIYSDLGIDPGTVGLQSYEASQFLFYGHPANNRAYLLLWQIGLVGEHTAKTFKLEKLGVERFVGYMSQWYPLEHEVIIYETNVLPIEEVRADRVALKDLPEQELYLHTTLIVPPSQELVANEEVLSKFGIAEEEIVAR